MVDLLLVEGLTGVNSHSFSVYGGMIESEDFLLAICKNKQDNEGKLCIFISWVLVVQTLFEHSTSKAHTIVCTTQESSIFTHGDFSLHFGLENTPRLVNGST